MFAVPSGTAASTLVEMNSSDQLSRSDSVSSEDPLKDSSCQLICFCPIINITNRDRLFREELDHLPVWNRSIDIATSEQSSSIPFLFLTPRPLYSKGSALQESEQDCSATSNVVQAI